MKMVLALLLTGLCAFPAFADVSVPRAVAVAQPKVAGVVNLNSATPDELGFLPGIGPAKAHAIVEHRREHPFKKLEDLTRVKGIGRKTFGKLRPYLTLAGPTTLKGDVKAR
ncbi:MAG: ComEA family DNA-binding protein [Polyangia bacterium]|jgi:competence protein ComEA